MLTPFCNENFKLEAGSSLLLGVAKLYVIAACVQTGTRLVSVVRSRGVSAIQGLLMYMEKHSGHLKVSVIS